MGDDTKFGTTRHGNSRGLILTLACLATLAGGCNDESKDAGKAKAETVNPKPDTDAFDTSRLPRVAGAKEVFASPATTIFTSPDPVAQTADTRGEGARSRRLARIRRAEYRARYQS